MNGDDGTRWDVIVVGAGASGSALAARLSEDPTRSVLLLEAGPAPTRAAFPPELLDGGALRGADPRHSQNWAYPATLAPDRPYAIARGRILGGSTALNGGYFVRARREDFDRWSASGNDEWTYDAVLPFYRRLETDRQYGDSAVHGGHGPMPVSRADQHHPAAVAFRAAAIELGFAEEPDKNSQSPAGIGTVPLNVVDGVRVNAGIAYIDPIRSRPDLTVRGDTAVLRVLFEGTRVAGVETDGGTFSASQVVLSAGAIATPHLLMLSGVGPRERLEAVGIDVIHDSPRVGQGFSDHPQVTIDWTAARELEDAASDQVLTLALNTRAGGSEVEILQMVKPTDALLSGVPSATGDLPFLVAVMDESSRGEIGLASSDPSVPPTIDFRYLSTAEDRRGMREAVRMTVRLLHSEPFAPLLERVANLDAATADDDESLDRWIRDHLGTALHTCGSVAFGSDAAAAVDQYGRVRGVDGLRVADTSILPTAPTRGPAATAVMIGERVADFIRRGL